MSHGLWKSLIYSRINILIKPIATFPLNYILTLDRSVEACDESRQITHQSPIRIFLSFIHSRLVVIDLTAIAYPPHSSSPTLDWYLVKGAEGGGAARKSAMVLMTVINC